jgi:hypothetical protein
MHLVHWLFGGQQITTHDAIQNVMYAFIRKNGHAIWRERWYALMLGVSLWTNFYMIWEGRVFVVNIVVTHSTWKMVASHVISWPIVQLQNLMPLLRFANIEGFVVGTILFEWPWRCMVHLNVIWIVSSRSVLIFSMIDDWNVIYPCLFTFNFYATY